MSGPIENTKKYLPLAKMETNAKKRFNKFIDDNSKLRPTNCRSCEHFKTLPYVKHYTTESCAMGVHESDPGLFFDGTDHNEIKCQHHCHTGEKARVSDLEIFSIQQEKIDSLLEALGFYAENKNWYNHHNINKSDAGINEGDLGTMRGGVYVGGKRARDAIAKFKK